MSPERLHLLRGRMKTKSGGLSRGLVFVVLAGYAVWVLFPMLWVAYSSLKPDAAIFKNAFALPSSDDIHWENYTQAWREANFGEYFLNSLVVTTVSVGLIVTLGARGSLLATRAGARAIAPVKVQAVDTTGAGDAFIGSFARYLAGGLSLESALAEATRYSALSVTRHGAQKSFATEAEFATFTAKEGRSG